MVAVLIYSVCLKFKPPDHPMKDITAKAIEDLASATSRYFIPLSHLRALDDDGCFNENYDPYEIPQDADDQEEINESRIFGAIEILSVSHVSSEEWAQNENLDTLLSEKYDNYFSEASAEASKKFGNYLLKGKSIECETPFVELNKFIMGDYTDVKIWKPYGTYDEYYYLVNSISAGDGDLLSVLWLAHITPLDYKAPKKRKLP
jgi:hypothetical protein